MRSSGFFLRQPVGTNFNRAQRHQGPPHEGPWLLPRTHYWGDIINPTPPGTPVVRGTAGKGIGRRAMIDQTAGFHWTWASEHRRFWNQCSSAKSPEAPRFPPRVTPGSGRRRGVGPLPDLIVRLWQSARRTIRRSSRSFDSRVRHGHHLVIFQSASSKSSEHSELFS